MASEQEFIDVVSLSATRADAAHKLGIRGQSVSARIDRLRRRGVHVKTFGAAPKVVAMAAVGLSDAELERRHFEALDEANYHEAQACFAVMCDRVQAKADNQ